MKHSAEIFKRTEYNTATKINGMKLKFHQEPYLDIVLTDRCNARCKFCIADLQKEKATCNYDIHCEQILYAINNYGVREVLLLGGEPTIYPRLSDMLVFLNRLKTKGLLDKICITTNGHKLKDPSFATEIIRGVTHLNISLMSTDVRMQSVINGTSNMHLSLEDLASISSKCLVFDTHLRINNNVFRGNNDTFNGLMSFYDQVKPYCNSVKFSPLLKTDNFSVVNTITSWVHDNILTDTKYEKLFKKVENYFDNEPIVRNKMTFGFVEYSMICLPTPIILNYNHRGQMAQRASEGYVNGIKLLTNGNLSLSWNKDAADKVLRFSKDAEKYE
jgi:molybdenum cofactor biosynthesis enzyme MoaA